MRRRAVAGVSEPGESADGAWRGARAGAGDTVGDGSDADAADSTAADGEFIDCVDGNGDWVGGGAVCEQGFGADVDGAADARAVHLDTSLDLRVFGFAALAAVVAALVIGLVPALQATSRNLHDHIKDGQHATQAHERQRILPRAMLAAEVGLALMLVVGAGLLSTSLLRLYRTDIGFDSKGLVRYCAEDGQAVAGGR